MSLELKLDNINYIKITYKDRSGIVRCTKAMITTYGEREIYACAKFDKMINIQTPQDVNLSFVSEDGIYRTRTTLKYVRYEDPYIYFAMKSPENMTYEQNREYFRVRINENAIITYKDEDEQKSILCKTYDISANGIRVSLNEDYKFPEEVKIVIFLNNREIKVLTKFIRTDAEDDVLKASFKFKEITMHDMDYISQQCIKKQLEEKRKKGQL